MDQVLENLIIDICQTSVKAHATYVIPRINNEKNQQAYKETMKQVLYRVEKAKSLDELRLELEKIKETIPSDPWYTMFSNPRQYREMAVQHANSVIDGLEARFVQGWSKSYIYNF